VRLGQLYLGLANANGGAPDHRVHKEEVAPGLVRASVIAAMRAGGAVAFDDVMARVTGEHDARVRGEMLVALSSVRDDALLESAFALALNPALKVNEILVPLYTATRDVHGRVRAWAWLRAHLDDVAQRLPEDERTSLFGLAYGCSEDDAHAIAATFAPYVGKFVGGPRALAQELEQVHLCAAQKKRHAVDARATFAAPSP
jgi:alanyl aminopeptidase